MQQTNNTNQKQERGEKEYRPGIKEEREKQTMADRRGQGIFSRSRRFFSKKNGEKEKDRTSAGKPEEKERQPREKADELALKKEKERKREEQLHTAKERAAENRADTYIRNQERDAYDYMASKGMRDMDWDYIHEAAKKGAITPDRLDSESEMEVSEADDTREAAEKEKASENDERYRRQMDRVDDFVLHATRYSEFDKTAEEMKETGSPEDFAKIYQKILENTDSKYPDKRETFRKIQYIYDALEMDRPAYEDALDGLLQRDGSRYEREILDSVREDRDIERALGED